MASITKINRTDANEPVARPKSTIRSRNSICETFLKRDVEQFEKDKAMTMLGLDRYKLDLSNFLIYTAKVVRVG